MQRSMVWVAVLGAMLRMLLAPPTGRADFIVSSGNSVFNVSSTGVVTANASGFSGPLFMALDPSGTTLYVPNNNGNRVNSLLLGTGQPQPFIPSGTLLNPSGVAVDSFGNIYVADTGNSRIAKFSFDGTLINANFITGVNTPQDVAVDSSGNVYVSTSSFERFSSAGGSTPNLTVAVQAATGIALGTGSFAGFAFVASANTNTVQEVNLSTGSKTQFNTSGTAISRPAGLAFDNNGNLFVTNNGTRTISEITPSGVNSAFTTSGLSLVNPLGITFLSSSSSPEPSSLLLSGLGLGMACAYRRWSRRRAGAES